MKPSAGVGEHALDERIADVAEIQPFRPRGIALAHAAFRFVVGDLDHVEDVVGARRLEDRANPRAVRHRVRGEVEHDRRAQPEDLRGQGPDQLLANPTRPRDELLEARDRFAARGEVFVLAEHDRR